MSAIVTNRFRILKTKQFYDRANNADDLLFIGIGRSQPWDDEATPDTPNVSPDNELKARHGLLSVKKLTDWAYCVPRYTWTSGNTYVAYDDDDATLTSKQFYVFNESNFAVYLCLKAGSGASTVEPTGTSTAVPTAGGDGYIWKYLYTISAANATKFLTDDYIPVLRDTSVAAAAVAGAIHRIEITSGGVGYGSTPTVVIQGDGSGATATATVTGGVVTGITMTAVGSGYTYAKISLTGGSPSTDAVLRAVLPPRSLGRELLTVDIDAAGATYSNTTADATLVGDGYNGVVEVVTTGGAISSATVTTAGYNYTVAELSLPVADFGEGDGNAALTVNFTAHKGGFGYDPVLDLKAYYVMVRATFTGAEGSGDFFTDTSFRQICVIKNMLDIESGGEAFTASTGIAADSIDVDVGGTWVVDDIIEGGSSGAQAYISSYDSVNERIYIYQDETTGFGTFSNGEALAAIGAGTSTGSASTVGAVAAEVDRYSGEMLYLENRVAVNRDVTQTEDLKCVIQF